MASILLASQGQLTVACGLIFLAAVFDVFDGLAARALGGGSPLGAQLDSLADMVSFGVAPAMLMLNVWGYFGEPTLRPAVDISHARRYFELKAPGMGTSPTSTIDSGSWLLLMTGILIVVASAWRLAKFNIDTRQTSGFLGLPTPANALFYSSLPLIGLNVGVIQGPGSDILKALSIGIMARGNPAFDSVCVGLDWAAPLISIVMSLLMLSELPLPSLKFKHKGWKGNEVIFCLLAVAGCLLLMYGVLAVPLILIIYLLSPLWGRLFPKSTSPPGHGDTEKT